MVSQWYLKKSLENFYRNNIKYAKLHVIHLFIDMNYSIATFYTKIKMTLRGSLNLFVDSECPHIVARCINILKTGSILVLEIFDTDPEN